MAPSIDDYEDYLDECEEQEHMAQQKLTWQACTVRIRQIYEGSNNVLDNMVKLDVIQRELRKYYEDEDRDDVFEGFTRMVLYLDSITSEIAKQHDLSLVKLALHAYTDFLKSNPEFSQEPIPIILNVTGDCLIEKALKIVASLKFKHNQSIVEAFQLSSAPMTQIAKNMITGILDAEDYPKAIQWMALLNLRDLFPFEQIAGKLISENQIGMLDTFVGEADYRRKNLLRFFDRLCEYYWKRQPGLNEVENKLICDHKKLQKLAVRYLKNFNLSDAEVPFVMNLRAYEALMYHHHSWRHGERSWNHFEELALPPIRDRPEIRDRYFNHLCENGLADKALQFAQLLHLHESQYPRRLREYRVQNPSEFLSIKEKITSNIEIKRRNEKIEAENQCTLDDGRPIHLVDSLDSLQELGEMLRTAEEKLVGIDAEWRPHFLSAVERISIMQIATSKAVYIVDVLWLDEKLKIVEDHWLNFFDALLCTQGVKKIGYDFRNDIRVMKSTFPFITKILPNAKEVICLYRLLQQVVLAPKASKIVFGSNPPKNLGLSDVVQFFLKVELAKNERIGNWSQRPLRLEQKKYAALDAYSLVELYTKIAPLILKLSEDQQQALQECAIIKFDAEEKQQPRVLSDGQVVRVKEGEDDFILNIQKASAELLSGPGGSTGFIRSIDDVRFVVDSMLFGLGKNLRKCGFDTRLIGERNKIVEFCELEENKDFIILSTGKGHKQLEHIFGAKRTLHMPVSTHTGAIKPSVLVNHVLRELKIAVSPDNMWSRCVDCNKRAFVRLPMRVVQVISYMNAVRTGADWLEITEEDLQQCFQMLRDESELTVAITPEMHSGEHPRPKALLDEYGYYLYEDEFHVLIETRHCTLDILNKLLLAEGCAVPVSIHVGLKFKKESFNSPDTQFFACAICGKVQHSNPFSEVAVLPEDPK